MTARNTPGPWVSVKSEDPVGYFNHYLFSPTYGAVGYWKGNKEYHQDNHWVLTKQDADLMAAAPELLEALEGALGWLNNGLAREHYEKAVSAINKAKGKL